MNKQKNNSKEVHALLVAGYEGDWNKVLSMIRDVSDINMQDPLGRTLLFYACSQGRLEHVRELLNHGINLHTTDHAHEQAIHSAITHGYLDIVKLLFENGQNVHTPGIGAYTLLHYAVGFDETASNEEKQLDIIKYLLSAGCDNTLPASDGFTPLDYATWQNYFRIIEILTEVSGETSVPEE